jgi:hypothetical protein
MHDCTAMELDMLLVVCISKMRCKGTTSGMRFSNKRQTIFRALRFFHIAVMVMVILVKVAFKVCQKSHYKNKYLFIIIVSQMTESKPHFDHFDHDHRDQICSTSLDSFSMTN